MTRGDRGTGSRNATLIGLCLGGLVGFAIGMLFAPAAGPAARLRRDHGRDEYEAAAEQVPPPARADQGGSDDLTRLTLGGGAG